MGRAGGGGGAGASAGTGGSRQGPPQAATAAGAAAKTAGPEPANHRMDAGPLDLWPHILDFPASDEAALAIPAASVWTADPLDIDRSYRRRAESTVALHLRQIQRLADSLAAGIDVDYLDPPDLLVSDMPLAPLLPGVKALLSDRIPPPSQDEHERQPAHKAASTSLVDVTVLEAAVDYRHTKYSIGKGPNSTALTPIKQLAAMLRSIPTAYPQGFSRASESSVRSRNGSHASERQIHGLFRQLHSNLRLAQIEQLIQLHVSYASDLAAGPAHRRYMESEWTHVAWTGKFRADDRSTVKIDLMAAWPYPLALGDELAVSTTIELDHAMITDHSYMWFITRISTRCWEDYATMWPPIKRVSNMSHALVVNSRSGRTFYFVPLMKVACRQPLPSSIIQLYVHSHHNWLVLMHPTDADVKPRQANMRPAGNWFFRDDLRPVVDPPNYVHDLPRRDMVLPSPSSHTNAIEMHRDSSSSSLTLPNRSSSHGLFEPPASGFDQQPPAPSTAPVVDLARVRQMLSNPDMREDLLLQIALQDHAVASLSALVESARETLTIAKQELERDPSPDSTHAYMVKAHIRDLNAAIDDVKRRIEHVVQQGVQPMQPAMPVEMPAWQQPSSLDVTLNRLASEDNFVFKPPGPVPAATPAPAIELPMTEAVRDPRIRPQ
ncbi:hypothetical protein BC831DRAFT_444274 [Entophlyctis helioformis]|nr:hypothetical protein BC831DRAFT_444274 [Entophlyctis helioformis]